MTIKQAIVLAAGRGERMGRLTDNTPKPLLRVAGEHMLHHTFRRLEQAGIQSVVVNCGYLGEQIAIACSAYGQKHTLRIHCSLEGYPTLNTGGGVKRAWQLLFAEPTLVINADVFIDIKLAAIQLPADSLAHLILVPQATHQKYADFALTKQGLVDVSCPSYTFSGVSVLHPKMFAYAPSSETFALRTWLESAITEHKVTGELFTGTWLDIGTQERLQAAEVLLK